LFSNSDPAALYEHIEMQLEKLLQDEALDHQRRKYPPLAGAVLRPAQLRGVVRVDDAYMTDVKAPDGQPYVFVDRDEAFDRMTKYIANFANPADDKKPLACVVASPGVGKTRLLDEIARRFANNRLCVAVSYNSKTATAVGTGERRSELAMMWRMILFYFFGFPSRDDAVAKRCQAVCRRVVDTLDHATVRCVAAQQLV
jgi:hypothetical protein